MSDDADDDDEPQSDEEIIQRELDENDVDAERALVVLVGTLVNRHMDCELRKLGMREPWPGAERTNSLVAVMDSLFQYSRADEQTFGAQPHPELPADDAVNVRRMLMRVLTQCQFLAERQAGISGDDDDDDRPMMRLVKD